eukprot:g2170.t1
MNFNPFHIPPQTPPPPPQFLSPVPPQFHGRNQYYQQPQQYTWQPQQRFENNARDLALEQELRDFPPGSSPRRLASIIKARNKFFTADSTCVYAPLDHRLTNVLLPYVKEEPERIRILLEQFYDKLKFLRAGNTNLDWEKENCMKRKSERKRRRNDSVTLSKRKYPRNFDTQNVSRRMNLRSMKGRRESVETPTVSASVDIPISEDNIGHRMLKNMGWKGKGHSLGSNSLRKKTELDAKGFAQLVANAQAHSSRAGLKVRKSDSVEDIYVNYRKRMSEVNGVQWKRRRRKMVNITTVN